MSNEMDFKLLKDGKKRLSNDKKLDYGFIEDAPNIKDAIFYMTCENIKEVVTRYSGNHHITTVEGDLRIIPSGWVHMIIENDAQDWSQRVKDTSKQKDVTGETSRTYYFPYTKRDRQKVVVPLTIENVVELYVRPSGTHRLKTADGRLHIVPIGWLSIDIKTTYDRPLEDE